MEDAIKKLIEIQKNTGTQPIGWNEDYQNWIIDDVKKRSGSMDEEGIRKSVEEIINSFSTYSLPTQYESMLHYPVLFDLLNELYKVKDIALENSSDVDINIAIPTIGTAQLSGLNALSDCKTNLIVVDRSLYFFLSSIVTIILPLFISIQNGDKVILPSALRAETLSQKIKENPEICKRFTEMLCSYVLFKTTWPYERYYCKDRAISNLDDIISREVLRFVVAHEFAHLLYRDKESTPIVERRADYLGAYLCTTAMFLDEELRKKDLYWAMAIAVKVLDVLTICRGLFLPARPIETHPSNRINTIAEVFDLVKADPYSKRMVRVVHGAFTLLWYAVKPAVSGIAQAWNAGRIQTIEEIKTIISYL